MPEGSLLCPNCRKLINADEPRCPHCGISHPGSGWRRSFAGLGRLDADNVLSYILYLNIGMYVLSLVLNPSQGMFSANPFGLLSPSDGSLVVLGATGTVPVFFYGRWWSVLSANYLHGGLLHIFFNMAALRQIGPLVVREYGLYRMIAIYTLGGVIGFVVSLLAGNRLTIGASAALCALMGALLFYGRHRGGSYGQAVFQQIWGWVLGLALFGFLMPGIDNWAHGGGVAAGLVLGALLSYQERRRENWSHRALGTVCVVLTLATLGWAVLGGLYARLLG